MPPAPRGARISYGPRRWPVTKDTGVAELYGGRSRQATCIVYVRGGAGRLHFWSSKLDTAERNDGMRRILWLALLAVISIAAPSGLAFYQQQPGADVTDRVNRATAQIGERSSFKIWVGRYQEFQEL